MNVTELARRLRISVPDLHAVFGRLGVDIGRKAIKVDDRVAIHVMRQVREDPTIVKEILAQKAATEEALKEKTAATQTPKHIILPSSITVREFAQALDRPVAQVIGELMKNGVLATLNEPIDYETAAIIAEDFGCTIERADPATEIAEKAETVDSLLKSDDASLLLPRPPVVVIMGHVDHGKTTLLDAIRKTNVAAGEAGGITQHIGAYQVTQKGRPITFIDTPGHEAFTAMRSRGAKVADVAVLVIAADDGVQPQTKEAYTIIDKSKLPFVVAITKIDSDKANVERVKQGLAEMNLLPEDWGGKVVTALVSGKTKQGIPELLDTLLLVTEVEKEKIRANPKRLAVGTIIESHVDSGEGPVATVVIQSGTLRRSDPVRVGQTAGRIRALRDDQGRTVETAGPSMPVQILGLRGVAEVGDVLEALADVRDLRKLGKKKATPVTGTPFRPTPTKTDSKEPGPAVLPVIVKADKLGSLEAILESLAKITHEEVSVTVASSGLGNISDSDILQAEALKALVVGFHVRLTPQVEALAEGKGVTVKRFTIIYDLLEVVEEGLRSLLKPTVTVVPLGSLKVLATFRKVSKGMIVGGRVESGSLTVGAKCNVMRNGRSLGPGKIVELQLNKQKATDVPAGRECGLRVETKTTILVGDVLEAYREDVKERTLETPKAAA